MDTSLISGTAPAVAAGRGTVWRTVIGCEWRLLKRDAGWWLAIALMLVCVAHALHGGVVRASERAASVAAARQDEMQRLAGLQTQLGQIERGDIAAPTQAWRDPRNALAVGRGPGATVVHLPDAPLAATAVGLSDLYPPSFNVSVGSRERFLFVDEIANPTQLATGAFDLAFVIVYLYPLMLLALSYNVLSGEREQGTLALTAASSAPLASVLAAKLALRAGGLMAALLAAVVAGLLVGLLAGQPAGGTALGPADALAALAALAAAVLLYGTFWLALALWVNSWRRDSAFNAVALMMAWVVLLLVGPAAINAGAQLLYPAPARSEMVLAVRQAAVDTERDREAEQARFRDEHGVATPATRRDRALDLVLAAQRRSDEVLARHEAMVDAQRAMSDRLAFLAPPVLVNDLLAELAGHGHTRWNAHLQRVNDFHGRWQRFFVDFAQRGLPLASVDYAHFPRFDAAPLSVWSDAGTSRALQALGWLAVVTGMLLWIAQRRLGRAE